MYRKDGPDAEAGRWLFGIRKDTIPLATVELMATNSGSRCNMDDRERDRLLGEHADSGMAVWTKRRLDEKRFRRWYMLMTAGTTITYMILVGVTLTTVLWKSPDYHSSWPTTIALLMGATAGIMMGITFYATLRSKLRSSRLRIHLGDEAIDLEPGETSKEIRERLSEKLERGPKSHDSIAGRS